DLVADGDYWIELWYRDVLAPGYAVSGASHIHVWLVGDGMPYNGNAGQGTVTFERTLGRWRKIGFRVKAPPIAKGRVEMSIRHIFGVGEIDGISVRPFTARQSDSLVNFLEGTETP